MIISVCADKGAPGVTTLATALGLVWPDPQRLVLEADTSGGDLAFRSQHADGDRLLDPQPSVMTLAADARGVLPSEGLARYAQPTTLGVPVIPAPMSADAFTPLSRLWPRVAETAASWPGVAIADLGRLQPGDVALPVTQASIAVVLLVRADLPGLYRLRERAVELAATIGTGGGDRTPVVVVVRSKPGGTGKDAVRQVRQVLDSVGSPVPIAGLFGEDPAGAALLQAGQPTRKLLGSDLVTSTQSLAKTLREWWPQLAATTPPATAPAAPASEKSAARHLDVPA